MNRTPSPIRCIWYAMKAYPLAWTLYIAVIFWLGMTIY